MNEVNGSLQFEEFVPVPMCSIDAEGKVIHANSLIGDVYLYDELTGSDIFALTGIKYETLKDSIDTEEKMYLKRNDRVFNLVATLVGDSDGEVMYLYFMDITDQIETHQQYEDNKTCLGIINIDNYDELSSSTSVESHMKLASDIDATIRKWAAGLGGSVIKQKENTYIIVFSKVKCEQQMELKFPILDNVREIETDADFPVTLSMGVGINGKTLEVNDELAQQALDLALGRGGDQAVVKDGDDIYYFGGKAQTVEKNNKGKSRVIGHALKRLMQASSKIFIMGHQNPDMDAFGAAMGIYRLAAQFSKEPYIILEEYGEALDLLYEEAKATGNYNIISCQKALDMVDERSLVIVVDTHKPSITECPEILEYPCKRVVIDHHRKGEEFVENPTLVYTEPYASSTSELVTEILQYTIEKRDIAKLEAEGLLAGIFVDTNHFSVKTGVRTFEAAAWLRRVGADLSNVKRLFQVDRDLFMSRANGVANAQFAEDGIAYAICTGKSPNIQMICSLVADELLTIRGMRAVFAVGDNQKGKTVISARSIGELNVQIIMEKFNGGGHLNAAGAQIEMAPQEVIDKIKEILEEDKQ